MYMDVSCFMEDYVWHVKAYRCIILSVVTKLHLSAKFYSLKEGEKRNHLQANNKTVSFQVSQLPVWPINIAYHS